MLPKGQGGLRHLVWKYTPRKLHKFGSRCYEALRVSSAEGIGTYRQIVSRRNDLHDLVAINLKRYPHPVYIRPGTSDADVLIQNLIRKEYGRLPRNMKASFIIDAGANIGDTAVYFSQNFRDGRIVALEPHPVFFPIAERNLRPYPNATLLRKGLWSSEATLGFTDDSTGSSISNGQAAVNVIETTDVSAILQRFGSDHIDILKMDIEGAEQEVLLKNSDSWLARTSVIIAELHGRQITDACTAFLRSKGFTSSRYRSLHYFVNNALRNPSWE